jgi:alkanesulfonate monooxygenase SsuD/methylene tetrahydromethanopterin reductase-like flavin-dependent oxidoreductase (luciferase family)
VLISLLSNELTNFDGTYYQLTEARCEPKGPQQPHPPIVIGGVGEKRILPAVARFAQQWDASAVTSAEDFAHKRAIVDEHCRAAGRDPGEIITSRHLWFDPAVKEIGTIADEASVLADGGCDLAIVYLAPPLHARLLEPLAHALAPLR